MYFSLEDAKQIRTLQLLIARAGNSDSLGWWDDSSLIPQGHYMLERILVAAPTLAARNLALVAASARHQSILKEMPEALHLFRLQSDNEDKLALRNISLLDVDIVAEPITSISMLEHYLTSILGEVIAYAVVADQGQHLRIEIPENPTGMSQVMYRAAALACAFLESEKGNVVIPYCLE